MSKPKEDCKFDLRTLEQDLREGVISQKDYEAYLKSLDDCEENVDFIEVYEEPKPDETTAPDDRLTFSPDDSESRH